MKYCLGFRHSGTVEYFIPMANIVPRGDNNHQLEGMFQKACPREGGGPVQQGREWLARSPLGQLVWLIPQGGALCVGAQSVQEYVSTAKSDLPARLRVEALQRVNT
jgi:hypothetical protein